MGPTKHSEHVTVISVGEVADLPVIKELTFVNPALKQLLHTKERSQKLFKVKYHFGQMIVSKGEFLTPCSKGHECKACHNLMAAVKRSPIPLALVLAKSAEIFVECPDQRSVPLNVVRAGELFGVFEALDLIHGPKRATVPPWSVSAGSRSVVILMGVNNASMRSGIRREFGTIYPEKAGRAQHYELIRGIYDSAIKPEEPWEVELLIFPDEWLTANLDTQRKTRDSRVLDYLSSVGWIQSLALRQTAVTEALSRRDFESKKGRYSIANQTHAAYIYHTAQHLRNVLSGQALSYLPVVGHASGGPFDNIQRLLIDRVLRGMRRAEFYPMILEPAFITEGAQIGLYSISEPSIIPHMGKVKNLKAEILTPLQTVLGETWDKAEWSRIELFTREVGLSQPIKNWPKGPLMAPTKELVQRLRKLFVPESEPKLQAICNSDEVSFLAGCVTINLPEEKK